MRRVKLYSVPQILSHRIFFILMSLKNNMVIFYNVYMKKISASDKKRIKGLNAELQVLQEELVRANKLEGKDTYIEVKVKKKQAHAERIKIDDATDKVIAKFYLEIEITAKQANVFIPLSIASGKKTAGFMYQIEGTAPGTIATANVRVRGVGTTQVTVGTLLYAKIPSGKVATFQIHAAVRGTYGKTYKIVFTRLNYKLLLTDARYEQYLKEIHSESV